VFIYDPSEICGYSLSTQINVCREIRELFKDIPYLIVVNKVDILAEEQLRKMKEAIPNESTMIEISALTGQGIETLVNSIFGTLDRITPSRTT
jgi:nucleolar GTP-binding protein